MAASPKSTNTAAKAPPRATQGWLALTTAGGFGFGLVAERKPFGTDILAHPLVVYFIVIGVVLLGMRVVLARPVPEIISERMLLAGCVIGCAAFLAGNWVGVHISPVK